jgi:hypothetical protein
MTFTRGSALLAPGYLLTPLTGLCKEEGFFILTPGSLWQLRRSRLAKRTGYQELGLWLIGIQSSDSCDLVSNLEGSTFLQRSNDLVETERI